VNREQAILSTARRKVGQGISTGQQYADLNAARAKRKRKMDKNLKVILAGGYNQIPILKCQ
jgi:hypothetical protein